MRCGVAFGVECCVLEGGGGWGVILLLSTAS